MNPFVIAFRRIIYSIPLKRLLLGLAVFGVLFASFSNAAEVEDLITYIGDEQSFTLSYQGIRSIYTLDSTNSTYCLEISEQTNTLFIGWKNPLMYEVDYGTRFGKNSEYVCITPYNANNNYLYIYNPVSNTNTKITFKLFKLNSLFNTTIPVYTSLECQTHYNLIPISSVDQNYCATNNLCPSGGTPSDCPNVGVSNLYINDIFHPGAFNVIMNIPEEIDWDYAYTNSGQNFNIDVVGYNQDFEKIEGWIETNNYKPTSNDFTNIFKNFSNFGGLLVGALFVILVFYFVKKMFK